MARSACIDASLTGAHRTEMDESQFWFVPTSGDPTVHSTAVTVDPIPHHFSNETTYRLKAPYAIKLRHSQGCIIALSFTDEMPPFQQVSFAAAGRNAGVGCHLRHQNFKVPRWETEIEIEFAKVVIIVRLDLLITSVKCLNDTRSDRSLPPIASSHNIYPTVVSLILG